MESKRCLKFKYWLLNKLGNLKYYYGMFVIVIVLFIISIGLFQIITGHFDFIKIQNIESNNLNRTKSIQIIESLKLVLLIMTPILTTILFLNTMNVQKSNIKNLGKDSMSKDFYNLLSLFNQEQGKSKGSMTNLAEVIKTYIREIEEAKLNLKINKNYPRERALEIKTLYNSNPNFLEQDNIESLDMTRDKILKFEISVKNSFNQIRISYQDYYSELGTYFRILHRLIKIINDRYENKVINEDERNMYIGILRAQLSAEELVVVLVNSIETDRGVGLGVELIGNSFFGDAIDIEKDQHFICPKFYKRLVKKYFVQSINSKKERKKFRNKFKDQRKKIKKFRNLI